MAHILLAEDDQSMQQFLKQALERAGHGVTACSDGLSAWQAFQAAPEQFDLLLADVVMPGMDGVELSQKAAAAKPGLKVLYITGFAAVAMSRQPVGGASAHILAKPFHLKELVDQVEELLKAA